MIFKQLLHPQTWSILVQAVLRRPQARWNYPFLSMKWKKVGRDLNPSLPNQHPEDRRHFTILKTWKNKMEGCPFSSHLSIEDLFHFTSWSKPWTWEKQSWEILDSCMTDLPGQVKCGPQCLALPCLLVLLSSAESFLLSFILFWMQMKQS